MLFGCSAAEIDARGLYAFVAHEVSQQGEVVEAFEEVLGETMTERMGIYYGGIDAIFLGEHFELLGNATCGDYSAETVQEYVAGIKVFLFEPAHRLCTQCLGDVKSA